MKQCAIIAPRLALSAWLRTIRDERRRALACCRNETDTMSITNRLFSEIAVGDSASSRRVCTDNDLYIFAHASGSLNPLSLPDPGGGPAQPPLAASMWVGALVSHVLDNLLPGPGALYRAQSFTFHDRVQVGDELVITVRVIEKREPDLLVMETLVAKANGERVADGIGEVHAPERKMVYEHLSAPPLMIHRHEQSERLLEMAKGRPALPTAVVCPQDEPSLDGALQAAEAGLIRPILIGDRALIERTAALIGRHLDGIEIIDIDRPGLAAAQAVSLVHSGRARAIMKGALHSDALLEHIVKRDGGLRGDRRISHVFVMDTPGLDHPLFISDAAINIAPDLQCKVDITQNAIDLARACGIATPRVGVLSAVETVNPNIPSTLDAAILSKMAERGQIEGAIVDGPLAMDNAVDVEAARTKGITSLVAGRAEVLIVPNMESGNMLVKELTFIAHAEAAGLVMGASVPVMLTSRADSARARLVSCALAVLYDAWRRRGPRDGARASGTAMPDRAIMPDRTDSPDPTDAPGVADR